ncbi:MAG TPA: RIP metalloprotease RseP [Candidatus Acidoferrales bacterium]|nr:RIP metalloprotease RseP [Candidatus Acidoferrales bacterium]
MAHLTNILRELIAGAVVLGVLVLIHEWGHFIAAKMCGVRVDVFSIGFGARIWGWKRGDTDYRVSWLPLGGYVKMAGDNPAEERSGAPNEFLSRPRWQRFIIAVAGPFMNILTTFLIFWGIYAIVGMPTDASLRSPSVVAAAPQSNDANSVQANDRILQVNGSNTPRWEDVYAALDKVKPGADFSVVVLRDGHQKSLQLKMPIDEASAAPLIGYPAQHAVIDQVVPGYPADKAGLQAGDEIVRINDAPVVSFGQLVDAIHNSNGQPVHLVVKRGSSDVPAALTPVKGLDQVDGQMVWQIGVLQRSQEVYEHQEFLESVRDATTATGRAVAEIGWMLKALFAGQVSVRNLAGPVGIVQMSGQAAKQGPTMLLQWTAIISINLGLLNLLPIPILDGGHVLLLLIESGMRRDLSLAFKERFVQVGLIFLLALIAFVTYSDILRAIQSR